MRTCFFLVILSLTGCKWLQQTLNPRDADRQGGSVEIVGSEENGGITGAFDAASGATQVLSASEDSSIAGASIAVPPGSLAISANISLGEGSAVATAESVGALGITDNSTTVASQSILVSSNEDMDPAAPMTLNIPLGNGLHLTAGTLVVFKLVYNKAKGGNFLGLILNPTLNAEKTKVTIKISEFGLYQAAYLATALAQAPADLATGTTIKDVSGNEVKPSTTTTTPSPVASSDLGVFSLASLDPYTNDTTPDFSWSASANAVSYDVTLTSDSGCTNVLKSFLDVQTTTVTTGVLSQRQYYACVTAKSGTKTKTASNNGVPFVVDTTAGTTALMATAGTITNQSPIEFIATFSEPNAAIDASDFDVTNGSLTILQTSPTSVQVLVTPSSDGLLTLTLPSGKATDPAGNDFPAASSNVVYDSTPPEIVTALTRDLDANGKVDAYELTFSEPVDDSTFGGFVSGSVGTANSSWNVSYRTSVKFADDLGTSDDATIVITFAEGFTADTGELPELTTPVQPTLSDFAGNQVSIVTTSDVNESDGAHPVFLLAKARKLTPIVRLYFSEPVYADTSLNSFPDPSFASYTDNNGNLGATSFSSLLDANGADGVIVLTTDFRFINDDFLAVTPDSISLASNDYFDVEGNAGIPQSPDITKQIGTDINGDGRDDLIIGEPEWDLDATNLDRGRVVVFFGKPGFGSYTSNSAPVKFVGTTNSDFFGTTIASHGDINGDGIDDIAIGAPDALSGEGEVYIFYGRRNWAAETSAANADQILAGTDTTDRFGSAITMGPNITSNASVNDIDDLVIGGSAALNTATIFAGNASNTLSLHQSLTESSSHFGASLAISPNFNGQVTAELLCGLPENTSANGILRVFNSIAPITPPSASFSSSNGPALSKLGMRVANAGDIDNDGYSDIVLGLPLVSSESGTAQLIYGASPVPSATPVPVPSLPAPTTGGRLGDAVAGIGDVNNNGDDDLAIGEPAANTSDGKVHIWDNNGGSSPVVTSLEGITTSGEKYGKYIAKSTDINADGFADLIVGAPASNSGSGKIYIYFGSSLFAPSTISATITGEANASLGTLP